MRSTVAGVNKLVCVGVVIYTFKLGTLEQQQSISLQVCKGPKLKSVYKTKESTNWEGHTGSQINTVYKYVNKRGCLCLFLVHTNADNELMLWSHILQFPC